MKNSYNRVKNHFLNFIVLRLVFVKVVISSLFSNKKRKENAVRAYTIFGSKDFIMGLISAYRFMKASKLPVSVTVVSDGTLKKIHQRILEIINVHILDEEHSKRVEAVIESFPNTKRLYKDFILMKKIVDLKVDAGPSTPIVYFDSDVLFTKKCTSFDKYIQKCMDSDCSVAFFNKDIDFSFIQDPKILEQTFNTAEILQMNAGLFIINSNVIDLKKVEEIISNEQFLEWMKNRFWVTEQTIYAILSAQKGIENALLPDQFNVNVPVNYTNETIHFVGRVRKQYYRGLLC